jgi:kinesin family protein 18/19
VAAGVRKKERRYVFDAAYDGEASNEQVYRGTVLPHIAGVLRGTNATVFAYGATGSGKTHTMVGDTRDPGLMVLSLRDVFRFISSDSGEKDYKVECSYTEVYNELVYDLLVPNSQPLELREDPERGTYGQRPHARPRHRRECDIRTLKKRQRTAEDGGDWGQRGVVAVARGARDLG